MEITPFINNLTMSKDKGTKNNKKPAATGNKVKAGSDYKNEGKVTAPIVIVPREEKILKKVK
jgi:hypothetical protein